MVSTTQPHGLMLGPGWARVVFLFTLLCIVAGTALAGIFDPPFSSSVLDASVYKSVAPSGSETAMSGAPTDVLWTSNTSPGSSMVSFGDSKTPGARHLRIGFTSAQTVGTVVVKGNVSVSVLKSGITYPGTLITESDWQPCERLEGAAVSTAAAGQRPGSNEQRGADAVTVWAVPNGYTSTRAIRFTRTAAQSDYAYDGRIKGVQVLSGRYGNLAPQSTVATSTTRIFRGLASTADVNNAEQLLTDLYDQTHTNLDWDYWASYKPWSASTPYTVSSTTPETITLVWPSAVSLRGLATVSAGFAGATVQYLPTSYTGHPRTAPDGSWTTITTSYQPQTYASNLLGMNWLDFGSSISTKAIRIRITAPWTEATLPAALQGKSLTNDGKRLWLGEMLAVKDLGTSGMSAAVVSVPATTNAPIPVTFTLSNAGYVTLVINDSTGKRVRNLISETYFPAGANTVYWDGLDESEKTDESVTGLYHVVPRLVSPGTYQVRGLVRNALTLTFEMGVNTAGNPGDVPGNTPWLNKDFTGGWLADHSNPLGIAFLPDSTTMLMGAGACELGNGALQTDLTGKVVYGHRTMGAHGTWAGLGLPTADVGTSKEANVHAYTVAFMDGKTLEFWSYSKPNAPYMWGDAPGPNALRWSYTYGSIDANRLTTGGCAVRNQFAAISLTQANQVALINAATGHEYNKVTVSDPRGLAFDSNGKLLIITGTSIARYAVPTIQDGMTLTLEATPVTGLTDPHGLTLDSNNDMYVSDWGTSNQVKVYTSTGTYVRAIGTAGAVPTSGAYDQTRMHRPWGLAISNDGGTKRLWVVENDGTPKRISRWALTGTFDKGFYGPNSFEGGGFLDPSDKTQYYTGNWYGTNTMTYTLDWTTGATSLSYLNGVAIPNIGQGGTGGNYPVYTNGQCYLVSSFGASQSHSGPSIVGIYRKVSGVNVPVALVGNTSNWSLLNDAAYDAVWTAYGITKGTNCMVSWTDEDNDQQVDANTTELKLKTATFGQLYVASDLTVSDQNGNRVAVISYTGNYAPRYDVSNASYCYQEIVPPTFVGSCAYQEYTMMTAGNGWRVFTGAPLVGYQNGTLKWTYPNEQPGFQEGMGIPPINAPGKMGQPGKLLGQPISIGGGEVFGLGGRAGQVYLLTTDGLFVSSLLKDARDLPYWVSWSNKGIGSLTASKGMDLTYATFGDNWFPSMTKTADGNVYLVSSGDSTCVIRVNGLDSITRISPADITVSLANLTNSADWQATAEKERQANARGKETFTIAQCPTTPTVDGQLGIGTEYPTDTRWMNIHEWNDGGWEGGGNYAFHGFIQGTLALSGQTLYGGIWSRDYLTGGGVGLDNAGTDWKRLFRQGDAIVLCLGTNAGADSTRTAPVVGDIKVVLTRVGSTTKATLYKQVASGGTPENFTNSMGRSVTMQDVQDISAQVSVANSNDKTEFAIPLSALGMTATANNVHLGDLGYLRGKGTPRTTYAGWYWNSKAPVVVGDEPYEVQCYPQAWGRFVIGAAASNPTGPVCTLTTPVEGGWYGTPVSVELKATAADPDGVQKVEFFDGANLIATDSTSPYSYTWTTASAGAHSITAKMTDNGSNALTSSAAAITVSTSANPSTANLKLWLKADGIEGATNNAEINYWPDLSGNNNPAFRNAAGKPKWIANALGGRPVLRFDGVDDQLEATKGTGIDVGNSTTFVVFKMNSCGDNRGIFTHKSWQYPPSHDYSLMGGGVLMQKSGNQVNFQMMNHPDYLGFWWTAQWWCTNISGNFGNAYAIATLVNDSATTKTSKLYTNGVLVGSDVEYDGSFTNDYGYVVSGRQNEAWGAYGANDIAEILVYQGGMIDNDRQAVENYLKAKYDFTGRSLWLKADAGVAYDGSNKVSQWSDSSYALNNASQANSTKQPTYVANAVNGKPAIRFDGTDDFLESTVGTGTDGPMTLVVVSKMNSSGNDKGIFTLKSSYFAPDYDYWQMDGGVFTQSASNQVKFTKAAGWAGTDDYRTGLIGPVNYGSDFHITTIVGPVDSNQMKMYIDGVLAGTDTTYNGSGGYPNSIGYMLSARQNLNSSTFGANDIAEVMLYNYALTDTDRQAVENSLKAKYDIGRRVLWLKADALTGLNNGDPVTTWTDSSSKSNSCTQATSTKKPTYITNAINGKPVVRFDGVDDYLESATGTQTDGPMALFVVVKENGAGANKGIFTLKSSYLGSPDYDYWQMDGGVLTQAASANQFQFTKAAGWDGYGIPYYDEMTGLISPVTSTSGYRVVTVLGPIDSNQMKMYIDGVHVGTDTTYAGNGGMANTMGYILSARQNLTNPWYGANDIAEVILYNESLTNTERQQIENDLLAKYTPANQAPTCTLTAPSNGTVYTTVPATISMTATASDSDGTVSKVEFYQGTTKVGEDTSSPYSYAWTNVGVGSYTLKATAIDDDLAATDSTTVNVRVNAAPTTSITSPADEANFSAGANVTIDANAADSDGTISLVEFYQGTTKLGEDSTSPYSYTWNSVSAGDYVLTSKAKDNDNVVTTSTGVDIHVTASTQPPTYQAVGTVMSGTGAISPTWPAHQAGDVALLVVESANQTISLSVPAGFVEVTNSPQGTGTAGGTAATRLAVYWKRATTSAEATPTVADSGDHTIARIITFRGVTATGNPWDVTAGNVAATAGTAVSIPGATTTVANTLVVTIVANATDTTSARTSAWANANLTSLTERMDNNASAGNGGGFGVATGIKATAGAYAATTATLATSSVQGRMSIALKP